MMDLENSTDEKNAKVVEAIQDIFEEHEHEGAVFMLAIFMNGLINVISMYSADVRAAHITMGNVLDELSASVEELETLGAFNQTQHLQ